MPPHGRGHGPGRKRGRMETEETEVGPDGGSPPSSARKKVQRKSPARASTKKAKRITWSMLVHDVDSVDSNLHVPLELAAHDDDDDIQNSHTAHAEAMLRVSAVADSIQQGASQAQHVADLVSINDTFVSSVKSRLDLVQDGVIKELEHGAVPLEVLPKSTASMLKEPGQAMGEDSDDETNSVPLRHSVADRDIQEMMEVIADQQTSDLRQEEEETAGSVASSHTSLDVGTAFPSKPVADAAVRLHSQVSMRVLPGTSAKCKVWCCRSKREVRTKGGSGTRTNPALDGSRASSFSTSGCQALIQVSACPTPRPQTPPQKSSSPRAHSGLLSPLRCKRSLCSS